MSSSKPPKPISIDWQNRPRTTLRLLQLIDTNPQYRNAFFPPSGYQSRGRQKYIYERYLFIELFENDRIVMENRRVRGVVQLTKEGEWEVTNKWTSKENNPIGSRVRALIHDFRQRKIADGAIDTRWEKLDDVPRGPALEVMKTDLAYYFLLRKLVLSQNHPTLYLTPTPSSRRSSSPSLPCPPSHAPFARPLIDAQPEEMFALSLAERGGMTPAQKVDYVLERSRHSNTMARLGKPSRRAESSDSSGSSSDGSSDSAPEDVGGGPMSVEPPTPVTSTSGLIARSVFLDPNHSESAGHKDDRTEIVCISPSALSTIPTDILQPSQPVITTLTPSTAPTPIVDSLQVVSANHQCSDVGQAESAVISMTDEVKAMSDEPMDIIMSEDDGDGESIVWMKALDQQTPPEALHQIGPTDSGESDATHDQHRNQSSTSSSSKLIHTSFKDCPQLEQLNPDVLDDAQPSGRDKTAVIFEVPQPVLQPDDPHNTKSSNVTSPDAALTAITPTVYLPDHRCESRSGRSDDDRSRLIWWRLTYVPYNAHPIDLKETVQATFGSMVLDLGRIQATSSRKSYWIFRVERTPRSRVPVVWFNFDYRRVNAIYVERRGWCDFCEGDHWSEDCGDVE
nr:uncharacterized protein CI109_002367 [Kwoniella shandongensis]KAA5529471.1 hypothetical protein CI109_002367 [Kwoniella shandongensis]